MFYKNNRADFMMIINNCFYNVSTTKKGNMDKHYFDLKVTNYLLFFAMQN